LIVNAFFLIMYVLALVCFLLASFGSPRAPHVNLMALGLVFFVVPPLVQTASVVFAGG
jgi:hypothetical protein